MQPTNLVTVIHTYNISSHQKALFATIIIILFAISSSILNGQTIKGRILAADTKDAIGFVNIGVLNQTIGTVSNEDGDYVLNVSGSDTKDSIRFSMIGYKSQTFSIQKLMDEIEATIFLDPYNYQLDDVVISYKKIKKITLGLPIPEGNLKFSFADYLYTMGTEIGINIDTKHTIKLNDININIFSCSFDSVIYRLNIYKYVSQNEFENILTEPIYISFSKNDFTNPIKYDLNKYNIIISGNILIALQLIKDMGPGELSFRALSNISDTYTRLSSGDHWRKSPGVIGMYLNGQILK